MTKQLQKIKKSQKKDFSTKYNISIDARHSEEADKLLKASIDTPPLTLKELKAKLKKEKEEKNGSK